MNHEGDSRDRAMHVDGRARMTTGEEWVQQEAGREVGELDELGEIIQVNGFSGCKSFVNKRK